MASITPQPFRNLLVPLDGSTLAEAAVPVAEALALRLGAKVTLVHVLEEKAPATVHGEPHLMDASEAKAYIQRVANRLTAAGVEVMSHVHDAPEGDVPRSIVSHSEELSQDLVVLCTHGSGGVRSFLYGTIAQQVLLRGTRPVLLVPPAWDGPQAAFHPSLVLVPLDREHAYQASLSAALTMAVAFTAELRLVAVVPTLETLTGPGAATGTLLPGTTRAILDLTERDTATYLAELAAQCTAHGVTVRTEVLRGGAVPELLDVAERQGAGMLVMATHGRAGLDAFLAGSTGQRLSAKAGVPTLLVKAP